MNTTEATTTLIAAMVEKGMINVTNVNQEFAKLYATVLKSENTPVSR